MTLSHIFTRTLATVSLIGTLVAPATVVAAPARAHADSQTDIIMSDGRICNPRWGCSAPDLGTEASVRPSSAHADSRNEIIMSDGRICNPRWGCNAADSGTEASVRR